MLYAPIISLFLLSMGNGLLMTLLPLRLTEAGASLSTIGQITSAYYVGLGVGALCNARLLKHTGHIRAYAIFAAVLSSCALIQAVWTWPWLWLILRAVAGWAVAGAFMVVESWLLAISKPAHQGRVLAIYMVACFASMAFGQLLIGPLAKPLGSAQQSLPYVFAAISSSLCLIPITLIPGAGPVIGDTRFLPPWQLFRQSPTGVIAVLGTGLLMGAILSLFPLYLQQIMGSHRVETVGRIMFATIIGGMVLQYPIGRWSDTSDRLQLLMRLSATLGALTLLVPLAGHHEAALVLCLFLLGGGIFSLYPVSISHSSDSIPPAQLVGMTQSLLLLNAVGSVLSPALFLPLMHHAGPQGLLLGMAALLLAMSLIFGSLRRRRSHRH